MTDDPLTTESKGQNFAVKIGALRFSHRGHLENYPVTSKIRINASRALVPKTEKTYALSIQPFSSHKRGSFICHDRAHIP